MIIFDDDSTHEHWWLSNYYPFQIGYFPSVQLAYFAAGCLREKDRDKLQTSANPRSARRIYNRVDKKPHWNNIRLPILFGLMEMKFKTEPFRTKLLETGAEEIVYTPKTSFPEIAPAMVSSFIMQIREKLKETV